MKKIKFSNGVKFNISPKEFVKIIAPHVEYEDVLFFNIKEFRKRGYLNKIEFLKLCYTKTNRVFKICKNNSQNKIRSCTEKAFSKGINDRKRVEHLIELDGVGMPRASFVLSAWNPINYGTFDYRISEILHNMDIKDFEKPIYKSEFFWYLSALKLFRKWRDEFKLKAARQVEYALWRYQFIGEISEKKFTL